jgi:hypothetical protein
VGSPLERRPAKRRANWPKGLRPGIWHPVLVDLVKGYPSTPEAYEAMRENGRQVFAKFHAEHGYYPNRKGIPDGWGRRGPECRAIRAAAQVEAKPIVKLMKERNMLDPKVDERGEEALEYAVGVIRAKDERGLNAHSIKDHLAACALVMKYTLAPPASTTNVNLNPAEAFLEALAAEV